MPTGATPVNNRSRRCSRPRTGWPSTFCTLRTVNQPRSSATQRNSISDSILRSTGARKDRPIEECCSYRSALITRAKRSSNCCTYAPARATIVGSERLHPFFKPSVRGMEASVDWHGAV